MPDKFFNKAWKWIKPTWTFFWASIGFLLRLAIFVGIEKVAIILIHWLAGESIEHNEILTSVFFWVETTTDAAAMIWLLIHAGILLLGQSIFIILEFWHSVREGNSSSQSEEITVSEREEIIDTLEQPKSTAILSPSDDENKVSSKGASNDVKV